jgi:UDP-N-acetylglucosamine diphosphorylase/glucosamine-1-phosphate N-acetyltransferase
MKKLVLFDDPALRGALLPFTFTRPVAEIRVGILKISEKWELFSGIKPSFLTQDYLSEKFPKESGPALMVNGALCPDERLWQSILSLSSSDALYHQNQLLAAYTDNASAFHPEEARKLVGLTYEDEVNLIKRPWQIFSTNGVEIKKDFERITEGRVSESIADPHTSIYNPSQVFIEPGAKVKAAVLNAENGPIYIGKNTEIQEGSLIRGPFALCEGSTVNMGAKVRGDSTIGPFSKVGGEISNAVIFGYSNKGHEGFLGNSVIGEWCNLGADTNVSNLKNNYASVKLWDYTKGGFTDTGLQFCGLMMGDHSKCGINTMFNTGTVVGVGANIFGDGFPRNFIPSFAWGGASGFSTFTLRKFDETTAVVMSRRGHTYSETEKEILKKVFELTKHYRIWDKQN